MFTKSHIYRFGIAALLFWTSYAVITGSPPFIREVNSGWYCLGQT